MDCFLSETLCVLINSNNSIASPFKFPLSNSFSEEQNQNNVASFVPPIPIAREQPEIVCNTSLILFVPPMYSSTWRNSESKEMESVIILLLSGNKQEEELYVTKEDGTSYLNVTVKFLNLFSNESL